MNLTFMEKLLIARVVDVLPSQNSARNRSIISNGSVSLMVENLPDIGRKSGAQSEHNRISIYMVHDTTLWPILQLDV